MKKKKCSTCGDEKPVLCFHVNKKTPDGLNSQCKECRKEHSRQWYAQNADLQKRRVRACDQKRAAKEDPTYQAHKCSMCGKTEPEVGFYKRKVGNKYYKRHACTDCIREYSKKYPRNVSGEAKQRRREALAMQRRQDLAKTIWKDTRIADKKKGRVNDLAVSDVKELLAGGVCAYCGESQVRLTLDRKDNDLGHCLGNVEVACLRCNGIRSNMPLKAWLYIAPRIREAREKGLFGDWNGRRFAQMKISQQVSDCIEYEKRGRVAASGCWHQVLPESSGEARGLINPVDGR